MYVYIFRLAVATRPTPYKRVIGKRYKEKWVLKNSNPPSGKLRKRERMLRAV